MDPRLGSTVWNRLCTDTCTCNVGWDRVMLPHIHPYTVFRGCGWTSGILQEERARLSEFFS
jgi:hypothetical protein